MKNKNQFHDVLEKYFTVFLSRQKNVSNLTIVSYRDTFIQLLKYFRDELNIPSNKITLSTITKKRVEDYLVWLVDVRKCSMNTRNHRLSVIRAFAKYLQYEDIDNIGEWQRILMIPMAKYPHRRMNYLKPDGIKLLLAQPDATTKSGRRHLAILALLCDTGARVQEIVDLKVSDLRIDIEPYSVLITGKGRKTRVVPLIREQIDILRIYIQDYGLERGRFEDMPLFQNSRGTKLTRNGVSHILSKYVEMAHNENPDLIPLPFSCHCLRHSKAMNLLNAGVSLRHIRDILGHASITSTEVYARADDETKRKALEETYAQLHPNLPHSPLWHGNEDVLSWLESLR